MGAESIRGHTALITGAARRIGRATALALAEEGVNIIVHYHRSEEEAGELLRELDALSVTAFAVQADFRAPGEYDALFARALHVAGRIDILVNNASIFPSTTLEEMTLDDVMTNVEVNAWVPYTLGRAFKRQVGKGKIINLLDSRITGYDWAHVPYILSKHMLAVLTRMTALDYAPDIAVNAVAPGLILPPPGKDESYLDALVSTVPLKRHGDAEDIADAVVFLAKSTFLTGHVVYVDGGRHLKETVDGRSYPH